MHLSRRELIGLGLAFAVAPCCPAWAAEIRQHLDAEQIKTALRAKDDEEKAFIDRVIHMVERGKMSRKLFDSAFLWARRKQSHRYEYFYYAITLLAKRENIDLT